MRIPNSARLITILAGDAMLWHFSFDICQSEKKKRKENRRIRMVMMVHVWRKETNKRRWTIVGKRKHFRLFCSTLLSLFFWIKLIVEERCRSPHISDGWWRWQRQRWHDMICTIMQAMDSRFYFIYFFQINKSSRISFLSLSLLFTISILFKLVR